MERYLDRALRCPLFRGIERQELGETLRCLGVRTSSYAKGEAVFREGDPASDVGIVLSGRLQIERTDLFGARSILAQLAPGEVFGESFACAGLEEVPVTVAALGAAQVLLIDCLRIVRVCGGTCRSHQRLIANLLQIVAVKDLAFHQKIEVTSKRTTREKLMTYLMLQAKRQGSLEFEMPFDRQGLADYLEVERSGLSAGIGKLRRQGTIEAERGRFKICRPPDA